MREEDKATNLIPDSPNQELIKKVDQRDKFAKTAEIVILIAFVIFSLFTNVRLQQVIDNNQLGALEARRQNTERDSKSVDRDVKMRAYVKCILLVRFDDPTAISTREGATAALDRCANNN